MILDMLLDFMFELLLEGSLEASLSRKVPLVLRIILFTVIIGFYGGLLYVIISIAIEQKSLVAWAIAAFVLVICILAFRKKWKERVNQKNY
ncbi:MAG: hypothetical protein E7186_06310 [Erysipelotrichaceae bacterium]|nr:hypothetical protein [Erysipelotrichaceae bacterium]